MLKKEYILQKREYLFEIVHLIFSPLLLVQTGREMHLFVSSQLGFRRVFGRESRRESTLGGIE